MKFIKLFENFNKSDLERELDKYGIENYTINDDGIIDVYGDVDLFNERLKKIPFKFGKITGNFDVDNNQLTSLENSPYEVGGYFSCANNKLLSLKGSPNEVYGFNCNLNLLTSLEGMPLEINGDFTCTDNPNLKELDSISNIEGDIYCDIDLDISKFRGYCKNINEI